MVAPTDIPVNSWAWLMGSIACLALGYKSIQAYRSSYGLLTKYICWFAIIMSLALGCFSISTIITLDPDKLRYSWIAGEFLVYAGLIPQAAIFWALVLRSKVSVYALTIPTAIIGFIGWILSAPNITLHLEGNFMAYSEPRISNFIMAFLLGITFIPAGFYFLKSVMRQVEFKDKLITFVLGLVYIGIGASTASHLIVYGQVASPISSWGNLVFFIVLFAVIAWPKRAKIKVPAVALYGQTSRQG